MAGPCDAGYYCRSGSDSATPAYGITKGDAGICPAGYYCGLQTAEPEPCPAGTFNNATGIVFVPLTFVLLIVQLVYYFVCHLMLTILSIRKGSRIAMPVVFVRFLL